MYLCKLFFTFIIYVKRKIDRLCMTLEWQCMEAFLNIQMSAPLHQLGIREDQLGQVDSVFM